MSNPNAQHNPENGNHNLFLQDDIVFIFGERPLLPLLAQQEPNNPDLIREYDNLGRLQRISNDVTGVITSYEYNEANQIILIRRNYGEGNGLGNNDIVRWTNARERADVVLEDNIEGIFPAVTRRYDALGNLIETDYNGNQTQIIEHLTVGSLADDNQVYPYFYQLTGTNYWPTDDSIAEDAPETQLPNINTLNLAASQETSAPHSNANHSPRFFFHRSSTEDDLPRLISERRNSI